MTKTCTKCKLEQDIASFNKHPSSKDGYSWWCKQCISKNNRKNFKLNYIPNRTRQKNYYVSISNNSDPQKALEFSIQDLVCTARTHSKRRKLSYDISYEYLMDLYHSQEGRCYYTNTPMKSKGIGRIKKDLMNVSIDRILPEKGYVKGNVVLCCFGINLLKHTHTTNIMMTALQTFYENAEKYGKLVDLPGNCPPGLCNKKLTTLQA